VASKQKVGRMKTILVTKWHHTQNLSATVQFASKVENTFVLYVTFQYAVFTLPLRKMEIFEVGMQEEV